MTLATLDRILAAALCAAGITAVTILAAVAAAVIWARHTRLQREHQMRVRAEARQEEMAGDLRAIAEHVRRHDDDFAVAEAGGGFDWLRHDKEVFGK